MNKSFGKGLLSLLLTFSLSDVPVAHAQDVSLKPIRVRLFKSLQSVKIRGIHLEVYIDGRKLNQLLDSDISEIHIERVKKNKERAWALKWNGEPQFRHYEGRTLELRGLSMKQGSLSLPRAIQFHSTPSMKNKFDLISTLDLEVYLSGVLPKEMPSSWPIEALKAQAVAARSYALVKMKERSHFHFDVESSVFDQAFEFSPVQYKKVKWSDRVQKALQSTRHKALFQNQKVIKAFYHADCGGKTELASEVWGGDKGFDGTVQGCFHPASGSGTWSFEMDREQLDKRVRAFFGINENQTFDGVEVASLSPSGRVKKLLFKYLDSSFLVSSQVLRQIVGFSKLKSTLFKIDSTEDKVAFNGQGNGHGVGMCQYGARKLAESGKTYVQILEKYFPSTELREVSVQVGE